MFSQNAFLKSISDHDFIFLAPDNVFGGIRMPQGTPEEFAVEVIRVPHLEQVVDWRLSHFKSK